MLLLQVQRFLLLLLLLHKISHIEGGGGDVLDSYGNAVALQHAAAAADVRGRIVVAVPSMIWILSPELTLPPHYRRPISTNVASQYRIAPSSFLIASGVAPDVLWLRQQLRLYYKHVQERYVPGGRDDEFSIRKSPVQFSMVTSLLLRQFWEDPSSNSATWMPSGYSMLLQGTEEDQPSWGRPLGLRCLLIQWNGHKFKMEEFDPSGNIVQTSSDHDENVQIFDLGLKNSALYEDFIKLRPQLTEAAASPAKVEALLLSALRAHDPSSSSWQLEILSPVDGILSVKKQILSPE